MWSWQGSNLRPPPCKGGALPAELQPRIYTIFVGLGRLELPTPALSERCSNQLSYKPDNIEGISKNVILSSTIDRVSSIFSLERR